MQREIIKIDEDKCTGCGDCVPNCPEGAIQILDGKARLVSDLCCDGLGACIGHCPTDAITVEVREAEPYDERLVMENIVRQGPTVIEAHLKHLKDHGELEYYEQAQTYLKEQGLKIPTPLPPELPCGCPGSHSRSFSPKAASDLAKKIGSPEKAQGSVAQASELSQWPVQMHLINPMAPHFRGRDLVLSADCVGYSLGNFHGAYLKGKTLGVCCPKLDDNQDVYVEKLVALIEEAKINTLHVMIMEVPCCRGLLRLAVEAQTRASRKVPIKCSVIGVQGDVLSENWM